MGPVYNALRRMEFLISATYNTMIFDDSDLRLIWMSNDCHFGVI
ncbi:Uncharacterised protein [Citrobacter youngae]|uniref:Uncharacterized protein n=1 Tax=Citrobacter youngae TaxID=133448 RepID=A0ABN7GL02_9ENTR|nr:Uncharacterised protein [Citrobacter youngae]CAC9174695.1 Uncharacterised protein [Citrobacter youngae]SXG02018.1 Uncharacterised protein [Klebsiella variicola]